MTVSIVCLEIPAADPVIVAVVVEVTLVVFTTNVIDVLPAGIVAVLGTVAEIELLDKDTTKPPVGATDPMLTVATLDFPPDIDAGFNVSELRDGGLTISETT